LEEDKQIRKIRMILPRLKIIPRRNLGIDIGTSSIRLVELSRWRGREKLENYGEIKAKTLFKKPFRTFEKSTLSVLGEDVSRAIRAIIQEAEIKTKTAIFSIPDFSSFFTSFDLPPMTEEELPQAVRYEARRHIPLPPSEVTLDWQIIEGRLSSREKSPLKILLVAVPNEVINQYREIASMAQLELQALEAEVFGLTRSLVKESGEIVCLVDIGAQTTTVSVIDKKILKLSHSFDVSGNELTSIVSKSLGISYEEAEDLKGKIGLKKNDQKIREILLPLLDLITVEIDKISRVFYQTEGKKIQKVILAGSSALLLGLVDYFSENLKLEKGVEIANPFSGIFYPPILENTLKEMGPGYAIAVGMSLRGLE